MPLVYDKANNQSVDTDSGVSLREIESRRETKIYELKMDELVLAVEVFFYFKGVDLHSSSVPPKQKIFEVDFVRPLADMARRARNIIDYRPYKTSIERMISAHNRQCDPDWPTEIIVNFDKTRTGS